MKPDETQVRELLPWYVNGTLDENDHGKLESHLARWPHLHAEAAWLRRLREQVREPLYDNMVQPSDSAGLEILMARIHAERSGKVLPLRPARVHGAAAAPRWFPAAVGLAASVILAQALVLGWLIGQPGEGALAPLSGSTAASGTLLQLTFKPSATEARMRQALAAVQGELVSGPGALGVYTVRVPEGQGLAALQKLQGDHTTVESAVLLQGR
jgi:anti-sigma factor RsiW